MVIRTPRSCTNAHTLGRVEGNDFLVLVDCRAGDDAVHALIAELRALGCGVVLIGDGDVAGVIAVTDEDTTIDLYMGQGGAPEGVLAAAALRCIGGQMEDVDSADLIEVAMESKEAAEVSLSLQPLGVKILWEYPRLY